MESMPVIVKPHKSTARRACRRSITGASVAVTPPKEGYRRGLTEYPNVLVEQNQLLHARERVARVQAERLGAHASLMTALGGGLADSGDLPKKDAVLPARDRSKAANTSPASSIGVASTGKDAS
uniref:hypothetical protein n=1 Tax=Caballeronia sp. LjRoot34 TaxID=3342325 RepID=UPI003F507DBA